MEIAIDELKRIGPALAKRFAPQVAGMATARKARRRRRRKLPQRGVRYPTEAEAAEARRLWWVARSKRVWAARKAKAEASKRVPNQKVRMRRRKMAHPMTVAELIARE